MPKQHSKQWSPADQGKLTELAKGNTPTRAMGMKLGRTEGAIRAKAQELRISLKPVNQSPYGTSKKK